MAWDSVLAVTRHSAELGWTLDAEIERPGADAADLRVLLRDVAGRPLGGAVVNVTAIHNVETGGPVEAALVTAADGSAVRRLPLARDGIWELRFEARWGAERFTATLRRERDRAPGADP
jgi:hypothetical protein